jgi:AcrR family transcriptional regulator
VTGISEESPAARPAGLRERKKARTRAAIREHALRLFRDQGYHATTIEQIAEAAEVSPSTFFRYFPTKEDVVLLDDMDAVIIDAFLRQPPELSLIAAFRAAMTGAFSSMSPEEQARAAETARLTLSVPELRSRTIDEFSRAIEIIAQAAARRSGRDPDDFAVRNVAGAIVGVIIGALMPYVPDHHTPEMTSRIDAALAHLEAGLPL